MTERPGPRMNSSTLFDEERELTRIRETQELLERKQREFDETRRRIDHERQENESVMPPLEDILDRTRRKRHEEIVSRGEIANIRRDQNRGLILLVLLLTATASLVWWGLRLIEG